MQEPMKPEKLPSAKGFAQTVVRIQKSITGWCRSEIGIRIALGASLSGVARLIVWQSLRLARLGVAIGVTGAFLLGKTISSLLFGVTSGDPVTLAAVSALLLMVAAAASFAPARRAARTDPLEAMRAD